MSAPSEGTPTKRTIGPFVIEGKLGVGGMGVVYKATYTETGQPVALKVLSPAVSGNPQTAARFEREMAILKRLRHPNIVRYFGGGRSGGQQYFAMEYVSGGSVEKLVKSKGRLPWEQALDILRQVAQALEYAHANGVIHRDLKPANLFFGADGKVKLGDFGIARDTDATALTAAGKTVGTYGYMAPEQIAGKPPISKKTDLYALGCVGFELLTGRTPFVSDTPAEMLFGHLNEQPPRVRDFAIDCPIWLDEVIDKLLEKDPEDRYFDALAVQVALDEVKEKVAKQASFVKETIAGATTAAATAEGKALKDLVGKPKKKRKKKGPVYERAWFLALCLLLVVGGITWAAWPPGEEKLYAEAKRLMATEGEGREAAWIEARDKYLQPLVERFPKGEHAKEAQDWLDQIAMDSAERQAKVKLRLGKEPDSSAERLFIDGLRYESEDRIAAIGKYRSMGKVLGKDPKARVYVRLADKRARELELAIGNDDQVAVVRKALREAERAYAKGRVNEARDVWNGVVDLFGNVGELEPFTRYARARLNGEEPEPPDLGEEEPADTGRGRVEPSRGRARAADTEAPR